MVRACLDYKWGEGAPDQIEKQPSQIFLKLQKSIAYTDQKENQIFLIYKEIQLQSLIWLTASSYMGKYLRISP